MIKRLAAFVLLSAALACAQGTIGPNGKIGMNGVIGAGAGGVAAPSGFAFIANSTTGCSNFNAAQTKCTQAWHVTPGSGHLLVAFCVWADDGSDTANITDASNGTWTRTTITRANGAANAMYYVFSAVNAAITPVCTASVSVAFILWEGSEYSYSGTLSSLDGTPAQASAPAVANVATSGTVTTLNSSDLLWSWCGTVTACSSKSPYTARDDAASCESNAGGTTCGSTGSFNTVTGNLVEDQVNVTAGGHTSTFGVTGATDNTTIGLIAF